MRAISGGAIGACVGALVLSAGCSRRENASPATQVTDASGLADLSVRVPGGLSVARAIDTLSVTVDPASFGEMQAKVRVGAVVGVETDVFVFRQGDDRAVLERRGLGRGADFGVSANTWSTARDGVPAPGTKYVVEEQLVLFATDVAPAAGATWDPHAGKFEALWRGTLRQAEE